MPAAIYNSPNTLMLPRKPLRIALSSSLLLLLLTIPCFSSEWSNAERQLAEKIAGPTGPAAVSLEVTNRAGFNARDIEQVRRDLITQLAAMGVRVVESGSSASVRVSLSESAANNVWVAEIQQGNDTPKVAIVSFARSNSEAVGSAAAISIRKSFLVSQSDPILDVGIIEENGAPVHLIVLDKNKVALLRSQQGNWQTEQMLPITHAKPWPRDLRGRVALTRDHLFDAYLPGVKCASSTKAPLSLNCEDKDEPWPLGNDTGERAFHSTDRNFFTGALVPPVGGPPPPRFYSALPLAREKYTLWLMTGVDGQLHFLDGFRDQVVSGTGWGSQIAAVKETCGGDLVLASYEGDGSTGDYIRAFLIQDREILPVSAPMEFSGPVMALWSGPDGRTAVAVVKNQQTGNYEAYRLAMACN